MGFAAWIQPTVSNDRWIEKNRKNEKVREVSWIFEIHIKSVKWQKVILRVNDFVHSNIESNHYSVDLETIETKMETDKELYEWGIECCTKRYESNNR